MQPISSYTIPKATYACIFIEVSLLAVGILSAFTIIPFKGIAAYSTPLAFGLAFSLILGDILFSIKVLNKVPDRVAYIEKMQKLYSGISLLIPREKMDIRVENGKTKLYYGRSSQFHQFYVWPHETLGKFKSCQDNWTSPWFCLHTIDTSVDTLLSSKETAVNKDQIMLFWIDKSYFLEDETACNVLRDFYHGKVVCAALDPSGVQFVDNNGNRREVNHAFKHIFT